MIKLKDLLKLDEIKYAGSIKPKHQKRMERELKHINEVQVKYMPPPDNSSKKTRSELHWLKNYNNGEVDESVVKRGDDIKKVYEKYCNDNKLKYPKDYIKELIKDSGKLIYQLKYKFNRPRPKQVANFLKMDLPTTTLESMHTPSYPSGHAVQGYLIGEILSNLDKTNAILYRGVGEDIAHSRIVAKAHYPSDKTYGHKIAMELFKAYK